MQKIPSTSETGSTNRINHTWGEKWSVRSSLDRTELCLCFTSGYLNQGPQVRAVPGQLRAVFWEEEEGRERRRGQRQSVTEPGCGGKPQKEARHTRLRQAFHRIEMGSVYLILTSASPPHFKKRIENSTLNIFHKFANANNYVSSFHKNQSPSFPHKYQFPARLVHAAALCLFNRLCQSFHNCLVLELEHFKQNPPEGSHALPLSKALVWFKKEPDSWASSLNLQNAHNHQYQRVYSHHWNLNAKSPCAAQTSF